MVSKASWHGQAGLDEAIFSWDLPETIECLQITFQSYRWMSYACRFCESRDY